MKRILFLDEPEVEVTDDNIVDDYMDGYFEPLDWAYNSVEEISDLNYFWDDYTDLTIEDKERIFEVIKNRAEQEISKIKEEQEITYFGDREKILDFIEDSINSWDELLFSSNEILDLILKNSNK